MFACCDLQQFLTWFNGGASLSLLMSVTPRTQTTQHCLLQAFHAYIIPLNLWHNAYTHTPHKQTLRSLRPSFHICMLSFEKFLYKNKKNNGIEYGTENLCEIISFGSHINNFIMKLLRAYFTTAVIFFFLRVLLVNKTKTLLINLNEDAKAVINNPFC